MVYTGPSITAKFTDAHSKLALLKHLDGKEGATLTCTNFNLCFQLKPVLYSFAVCIWADRTKSCGPNFERMKIISKAGQAPISSADRLIQTEE